MLGRPAPCRDLSAMIRGAEDKALPVPLRISARATGGLANRGRYNDAIEPRPQSRTEAPPSRPSALAGE